MHTSTLIRSSLLAAFMAVAVPQISIGQQTSAPLPGGVKAPVLRDGQKDFDWEIGSWKTHLKR